MCPTKRSLRDNTQQSPQTESTTPARFEPASPANERSETHALDHAATAGIGRLHIVMYNFHIKIIFIYKILKVEISYKVWDITEECISKLNSSDKIGTDLE